MKKSLLALAALTAFAGVASAQSSVTLFGGLDLNLRNVKNGSGGSLKTMSQDYLYSSRLGFRGVEDLGGGLRAGFHLEGAIAPDTGTPAGQTWRRRSTLSLMGGFGEIRLGRDYVPSFWNHAVYEAFGLNGIASSGRLFTDTPSALGSGVSTQVRADNSIGYHLPAMGGLFGQVMVAAGENVAGAKHLGARFGYAAGPVSFAVGVGKTSKTHTMADDYSDINVGGSFNMGFMTLFVKVAKIDYAKEEQKQMVAGVRVPVGAGEIRAQFAKSSGSTASAVVNQYDAKMFGVGYLYNLSKRTAVYGTYASINNGGNTANGANFVLQNGPAGIRRGESSTGYEVGLKHEF